MKGQGTYAIESLFLICFSDVPSCVSWEINSIRQGNWFVFMRWLAPVNTREPALRRKVVTTNLKILSWFGHGTLSFSIYLYGYFCKFIGKIRGSNVIFWKDLYIEVMVKNQLNGKFLVFTSLIENCCRQFSGGAL